MSSDAVKTLKELSERYVVTGFRTVDGEYRSVRYGDLQVGADYLITHGTSSGDMGATFAYPLDKILYFELAEKTDA